VGGEEILDDAEDSLLFVAGQFAVLANTQKRPRPNA
jgi:hypothetical protein